MRVQDLDQKTLDKIFEDHPYDAKKRLEKINGLIDEKFQNLEKQGKEPLTIMIELLHSCFNAFTYKRNTLVCLNDPELYKREAEQLERILEPIKNKDVHDKSPEELFLTLEKASNYPTSKFIDILKEECPSIKQMQQKFKGTQYELRFYNRIGSLLPSMHRSKEDRDIKIKEVYTKLNMTLEDQKTFFKDGLKVAQTKGNPYYEGLLYTNLSHIAALEFNTAQMNFCAEETKKCAEKKLKECKVNSNSYKCTFDILSDTCVIQAYNAIEKGNHDDMRRYFAEASQYTENIPDDKRAKDRLSELEVVIKGVSLSKFGIKRGRDQEKGTESRSR